MTLRIAWTTALIATTGAGLVAQSTTRELLLPQTSQRLDALEQAESTTAHLVVAVDASGRTFLRTTGVIDPELGIPLQQHARVPLGALTRYLLHEAFRRAVDRRQLCWSERIGATLPDLPDAVRSHRWAHLVAWGPTFLPNYLRWVRDPQQARPLKEILGDHAFVPYGERQDAERSSMLRAALMQSALERVLGEPWPEILDDTARELGVRGVFASEPRHRVAGVARLLRGDKPSDPWHAEVASAGGATATVPAIAALLRHFVTRDVGKRGQYPESSFYEWYHRDERGVAFVERHLDAPGVSGSVRSYTNPRVAVFTFANRHGWSTPEELQKIALADLVDGRETPTFWMCGGVRKAPDGPEQTGTILYGGVLELHGVRVPLQLEVTRTTVSVRAATGTVRVGRAFRVSGAVHAELSFPSMAVPGRYQAELRLFANGDSLCGKVSFVASAQGVGKVEDLPYAVTFARLPEDARRLPLAPSRR